MSWTSALPPVVAFLAFKLLKFAYGKVFSQQQQEEEQPPKEEEPPKEVSKERHKKGSNRGHNNDKVGQLKKTERSQQDPKKKKNSRAWLAVVGCLGALGLVGGWSYRRYGPLFFASPSWKRLDLTSRDWQELLERNRSVAFVGGHHRSGTTVIWRAIAQHPKVAWFGEERECGLDFSEGAFAQDVYPRFGVGTEFSFFSAQGGIGRYAMADPRRVLWTEERATLESQARVLNAFGFYWQRKAPDRQLDQAQVFLEKSPPNVVLARYLQALVDLNDKDDDQQQPKPEFFFEMTPKKSRARFVFVTRHPLANAESHRRFPGARWLSIPHLVAHWLAVENYADANARALDFVYRLTLETFARDPATTLVQLWTFLGLLQGDEKDQARERAERATAAVDPDPNGKYRRTYCHKLETTDKGRIDHDNLVDAFGHQVKLHGYDLDDFCHHHPEKKAHPPPPASSFFSPPPPPPLEELDDETDLRPKGSEL